MFYVYIIYSKNIDAFYVGQTMDMETRIEEHNSKFYNQASTSKANDWEIFHCIKCHTRTQAILIERHIKNMKSRKYFGSLKLYPEISLNLLEKYK